MNSRIIVAALALLASAVPASAQWRAVALTRDTSLDLKKAGFPRTSQVLINRDGRILIATEYFGGEIASFDSALKKLPWKVQTGRKPEGGMSDVVYVNQWGFVGDSVWLLDPYYKHIAYIGTDGSVAKSIGFPSWVRPFWKDRRKYPLFANMAWQAAYPDATLLVEPSLPRRILDTPGYDADQRMLVRVDGDGRVVKLVARMPAMDGRVTLRSGTERTTVNVPNFPKAYWKVSTDGRRVAVVTPIASDSGAFRVDVMDENGDTVFTKRYAVDAARMPATRVDSLVAPQKGFGRYSVEQVRDTVRKLIPAFYTPLVGVDIGLDYSVWVSVRRPTTKIEHTDVLVLDPKGEPVGITTVLRNAKIMGRSLDRLWIQELDRGKNTNLLVLYSVGPKAARPSRSVRAAASSQTGKQPE
jgi:hypothetical protein